MLERLGSVVNFTVPLVFAPGGITQLSKKDLLNLLEQLEANESSASNLENPHAPL